MTELSSSWSNGEADPVAVARTIALRRLEAAPRSRHELTQTLRDKNVPEDAIDQVLDRFTEVGLIDDQAFAEAWVASRHRGRGLGRRALANELRRKGIAPETIEAAIDQLDDDDERMRAEQLVRSKMRALVNVSDVVATRRLVGQLTRKGYAPGLAFDVVRKAMADRAFEHADDVGLRSGGC